MADLTAQKTLVKSPPELWTELSEVESLAKHLGELGEIRITRVEPESTVAWEGEDVCGTVELEQSGWGTKVTFRATVPEPGPAVSSEPEAVEPKSVAAEPEPVAIEPEPVAIEPEPEPVEIEPDPEPVADPEPLVAEAVAIEPDPEPKRQGFFARWLFRQRAPRPEPDAVDPAPVAVEPEPVEPEPMAAEPMAAEPVAAEPVPPAEPEPPADPEPVVAATADADRVQRVLEGTLEALGQAHHRPFSRG